MLKSTIIAALLAGVLTAGAAQATVTVGYSAVGVQQAPASVHGQEVATFDDMSGFVGSGSIFSGPISGTIQSGGFVVYNANVYGGAGGTGKFGTVYDTTTIQLSRAVTYAGLWASAIDGDFNTSAGNTINLYSAGSLLGSYALKPLLASASSDYWSNPNAASLGTDNHEPYAFFNFKSTEGFDRIDIVQNGGGGFELDNVTIGNPVRLSTDHSIDAGSGPVPEPASWAMMLTGFGLAGAAMRISRRKTILAA
jgi:hypothetical protein